MINIVFIVFFRLHKGAYACAAELCLQIPTEKHVAWCVSRIQALKAAGLVPVAVFDGARLPSKAGTEDDRQRCAVLLLFAISFSLSSAHGSST